jgi:hypothetical protein
VEGLSRRIDKISFVTILVTDGFAGEIRACVKTVVAGTSPPPTNIAKRMKESYAA